jgi:hypothetical protein
VIGDMYGLAALAIIFGGGLLGLFIGKVMHDRYRDDATQRIVQTATTMISLLAALVLGLLVATAKNKFDTSNTQIEVFAAGLMSLDRDLVNYGPEAKDIRSLLRAYVVAKIGSTWLQETGKKSGRTDPPASQLLEDVQQRLSSLTPQSGSQRAMVSNASEITADLIKTSWLQTAQDVNDIPHPFIMILMVWFSVLCSSALGFSHLAIRLSSWRCWSDRSQSPAPLC